MDFHENLWESNKDSIERIIGMDFIQDMVKDSLSDERFYYYIEQDIHYLHNYIKASSLAVSKSENNDQLLFFHQLCNSAFEEMKNIHQTYLSNTNYSPKNTFTPAFCNYSNFLLAYSSTKPLAITVGGMLACPWLYLYIGMYFKDKVNSENRYKYWFEANSIPIVQEFVQQFINVTNDLANQYPQYHEQMNMAFREALHHEFHFWQDAYDLKKI